MSSEDIDVRGCHNLLAGFWRQVRRDLRHKDKRWRDDALAFLEDPARYDGWCSLTGIADTEAWAEILKGEFSRDASARCF